MSAEHFFQHDPMDTMTELAAQAAENPTNTSPMVFLAENLIDTTRIGMKEVSRKYEDDTMMLLDRETGTHIRDEAVMDYSSSIFGNLIIELEDTRMTGEFDLESFIARSNASLTGTAIPDLPQRDESIERYYLQSAEEREEFNARYEQDRTYADFFQSPRTSLPENLLQYLDSDNHLRDVVSRTFPTISEYWKVKADEFLRTYQEFSIKEVEKPTKALTLREEKAELESMSTGKKSDIDKMVALQKQGFSLEDIKRFIKLSEIREYEDEPRS